MSSETAAVPVSSEPRGGVVRRQELFDRLSSASRVTLISAPAGSGKTLLVRSWIAQENLAHNTAWVSVGRDERDAQRFWRPVLNSLNGAAAASTLVRAVPVAPDFAGDVTVDRLLADLDSLGERVWLVIDDLHELRAGDVHRQLELLLARAPEALRFLLMTRRDLRLGLHRLRLEGELTEIRADALRFTLDEAKALLEGAGVQLSASSLALMHERTEGWAAGLRLAALSLADRPDPDRFAAEFSGSERTVAEYLLTEVLERQPDDVKRLLLRTAVLDRVSGPLADHLTGGTGSERILQELEEQGAFVASLDAGRSWFRYHPLFADLLALELRRTAPDQLPVLHSAAAEWLVEHGQPVDAIRHAQAGQRWRLAADLLADQWPTLQLNGQSAMAHELLTSFPAGAFAADPVLAVLKAAAEVSRGSSLEAERYLSLATRGAETVDSDRSDRLQVLLGLARLALARQSGDLPVVSEQARRLLEPAMAPQTRPGIGEDLQALALMNLGTAELWTANVEDADRHLAQGAELARTIERPYLEIGCLASRGIALTLRSSAISVELASQAIELAEQNGWSEEPIVSAAYTLQAGASLWQGRLEDADRWLARAKRTVDTALDPMAGLYLHLTMGLFELAHDRSDAALAQLQKAERLGARLVTRHVLAMQTEAFLLQALVRLGKYDDVEHQVVGMDECQRQDSEIRKAVAALRLAQGDPDAAVGALAPVLDGSVPVVHPTSLVDALVLETIARHELGDAGGVERALEEALDIAEPNGIMLPFLLHPVPEVLNGHSRHRTTHAALVDEIIGLLAGRVPSTVGASGPLREPLSESETRVLRYLPTNLSAPEIANELYLSVHTVKTHMRTLYSKLGVHRRAEAVERARSLGLLAPSSRRR
jgi:LuxR family transcriptional regulator, maltose regulon positive regulatory protein